MDHLECRACKFREATSLFELCTHRQSEYRDNNGKQQLHTVGHMRTRGGCKETVLLFQPRDKEMVCSQP